MTKRRALVLGASQGIGAATAKTLASDGYQLTLMARSEDKLADLCSQLKGEGHDFIAADFAQPDQWMPALEMKNKSLSYNSVILNSGGPKGGAISQAEPQEFLSAMQNHLVCNSLIVKTLLPEMKKQKWGRVVTITSTSVKVPIPHLGVSNTVRAAVASWAKTLSLELAPFAITVNNVMPGFTKTPRLENLMRAKADGTGQSFAEVESAWKAMVPMQRFAEPEETADLISFLCSAKANYITGQSIAVDGGRLGCL